MLINKKRISIEEFDWKYYVKTHVDLQQANVFTKEKAWKHWKVYGKKEKRKFRCKIAKKQKHDPNKPHLNIIGIQTINCSISDNLSLLEIFFQNQYNITVLDFSEVTPSILSKSKNTLICIQPFELSNDKFISWKLSDFKYKPNVFWVWEFKKLPSIFTNLEKYVNKIYVPSEFCKNIFLNYFKNPVEKIKISSQIHQYLDQIPNHIIQNDTINQLLCKIHEDDDSNTSGDDSNTSGNDSNSSNGITAKKIVFGYCFDMNGSIIRKNPLNLVRAFNKINKLLTQNCILVLKYRKMRSGKFASEIEKKIFYLFQNEINKNENIVVINDELDAIDLYKLYTYFDYYISSHRSEGYGFTIYDNMILGNKIISTYYSGETEYLNKEKLIELQYTEKIINDFNGHPVYGLINDLKCADVSVNEIKTVFETILSPVF